ncbi:hypothetical protein CRUP_031470 [Coryphaenoides rupestris]|nr:hypothetical protein CRUP_031470 [Coryphaenoides rupestris]
MGPCAMVVPDFELICEIMLDHYDWGLRAIKSVLVVAGALKRGDPGRAEDQVLMRALRDFNVPKIVTDDMPVFMGLIGDLFPALDVPRKRDMDFEKNVRDSVLDLKLQAEDNFILKVQSHNWFTGPAGPVSAAHLEEAGDNMAAHIAPGTLTAQDLVTGI